MFIDEVSKVSLPLSLPLSLLNLLQVNRSVEPREGRPAGCPPSPVLVKTSSTGTLWSQCQGGRGEGARLYLVSITRYALTMGSTCHPTKAFKDAGIEEGAEGGAQDVLSLRHY